MSIPQARDYETLKRNLDIESFVMNLLPKGKGYPEWKALNPTRDDKRVGSFQVNLQSGLWTDFATGEGGDILSLYCYIKGCSITDAYDSLINNISLQDTTPTKKIIKKKRPPSRLIYPPPLDAGEPIVLKHDGYWCYRDKQGCPLMYVTRHNPSDRDKFYLPHTYRQQEDDLPYWDNIAEGLVDWPLYNLNLIHQQPNANILIVEGEKTADAAAKLLKGWVITTWHGGANAVHRVAIEHLRGRLVWLWPDNDDTGVNAMITMQTRLKDVARQTQVIELPRAILAKGWDLADGLLQGIKCEDVMELIEKKDFCYPVMSDTKNPYALDVTENLKYLLDYHGIVVKWNMMKRDREIVYPGREFYNEEAANESLSVITNLSVKFAFNIRRIDKHLDVIAFENRFHPVRDWILGTPVIDATVFDKFLSVLKTTNDTLSRLLLKRWLISAIGVLFNESDYRAQGVLVIQGAGGWYKTSFIASLVPHKLSAVFTGAHLDPSSKDSVITLSEHWIAELGELGSTFKKSDIDKLKAHITQSTDTIRRPFAAKNSKMLRRTIFAASVNEENFLVDETGNRRWWVISLIEKINIHHGLNMQQVWRSAYDLWLAGEKSYLDDDELKLLNQSNEYFETIDPFMEKFIEMFDTTEQPDRWIAPSMVLNMMGYSHPSRNDSARMGAILTKMDFKKKRDKKSVLYLLPVCKQQYR